MTIRIVIYQLTPTPEKRHNFIGPYEAAELQGRRLAQEMSYNEPGYFLTAQVKGDYLEQITIYKNGKRIAGPPTRNISESDLQHVEGQYTP